MQKIISRVKRFFFPISYTKGRWRCVFFAEVFDAFQSVFVVQVGTFIIQAIEKNDQDTIIFWGIILSITFFLSYFFSRMSAMAQEAARGNLFVGLRRSILGQYIYLDNTKVETIGTGKMQNIIFDGISYRVSLLLNTVVAVIVEILAIIYAFSLMAQQSPNRKYFLGFFMIFGVSSALIWIGLGVLKKTRKKSKELNLDAVRRDIKILMSKFEILQNNKLSQEMDKQELLINKQTKLWQKGNTIKTFWQVGANMLLDGAQIWIYIFIGIGVMSGNYTFAYMMLLLQLFRIISRYVWNIRNYLKEWYKGVVHVDTLWETFDSIPSIKDDKDKKEFTSKEGGILLQNLSFSYNKKSIFSDFSLPILGGKKTAFVGPSGGGKTTLIKLLAGYIAPDAGDVLVDGQKLSEIKLADYYKHIGYLTQDPSVFDGTIHENLVYALDSEPKKEDLEHVIVQSKCEFIRDFEKGLETEIGERGVRLSGGQKQRLAIAKIMLKNPNIILLDEPTSALDSFNEELITIALHNLFKGKTVVVVAHRLQTVKQADMIYYLEAGERGAQVVESGTHDELVIQNGKYKKMLDLQSGF